MCKKDEPDFREKGKERLIMRMSPPANRPSKRFAQLYITSSAWEAIYQIPPLPTRSDFTCAVELSTSAQQEVPIVISPRSPDSGGLQHPALNGRRGNRATSNRNHGTRKFAAGPVDRNERNDGTVWSGCCNPTPPMD